MIQCLLGPFSVTNNRYAAVDFTFIPLESYFTIVVPLRLESDTWSMIDPFSYEVWFIVILYIPLYVIIMGLADYVFCGTVDWEALVGFILRTTLSENDSNLPENKWAYQKLFLIFWISSVFVLIQSYAGNLTAMLTRPTLPEMMRNAEDLLSQDDISLVMEKGTIEEFHFRAATSGTTLRRLYKRSIIMTPLTPAERFRHGCYTGMMCKHDG